MEKRALIAFVLCILLITVYPYYLKKQAPLKEQIEEPKQTEVIPETPDIKPEPPELQKAPTVQEKEFTITTPLMEVTFSNYGATIKQLLLLEYLDHEKEPLELVTPVPILYRPLAIPLFTETILYKAKTENDQITFTATHNNLKVTKIFTLDPESYVIKVDFILYNTGSREFHILEGYTVSVGTAFPGQESQANMYLIAKHLIDGKFINNRLGKPPFQKVRSGSVFWSAVKNRFFALILKPKTQGTTATVKDYSLEDGKRGINSKISMPEIIIRPNERYIENFDLYAGPKKYDILKTLGSQMDAIMDFGLVTPISKVTLTVLNFFYGIVHNYGVAIILLTILIRLILYPLTFKSYKSMHEMQKIQPLVKELQAKYKDDPKRVQKEMMLLYKEHKVNPFGGCLPMLLQMPILIGLFTTLRSSIELRGAPFILWIKDLSEPDALFTLKNSLPIIGNKINILPLFMLVTFFIQQKMTVTPAATEQQRQQQKMMSKIMPIFLGVIFYNMPSGLVLYFSLSTLIGILDQYRIKKKMG